MYCFSISVGPPARITTCRDKRMHQARVRTSYVGRHGNPGIPWSSPRLPLAAAPPGPAELRAKTPCGPPSDRQMLVMHGERHARPRHVKGADGTAQMNRLRAVVVTGSVRASSSCSAKSSCPASPSSTRSNRGTCGGNPGSVRRCGSREDLDLRM